MLKFAIAKALSITCGGLQLQLGWHNMTLEIAELRKAGYEVELDNTEFSVRYATNRIKIPKKSEEIPQIIGWSGPSRSGTTGLLFLLAGYPFIKRAYFQPLKTLLRLGKPNFSLRPKDKIICMKEVFLGCCKKNRHDPIEMLLNAGVPAEKIRWITILRDPINSFSSWREHIAGATIENFAKAQDYTIEFFYKYKQKGLHITPFAYDLLSEGEEEVISSLFKSLDLDVEDINLSFDLDNINKKMVYGQASHKNYFNMSIKPILDRKAYIYSSSASRVSYSNVIKIRKLCQADYDAFYNMSKLHLNLDTP